MVNLEKQNHRQSVDSSGGDLTKILNTYQSAVRINDTSFRANGLAGKQQNVTVNNSV